MPDPHKDLADIVEPQIAVATANANDWLLIGAAAVAGLVLAATLYWQWRRLAPLRALRHLRGLPEPQRAADALAALIPQFKTVPDSAWLHDLNRLRFGPASDDAQATLSRLCEAAELLLHPIRQR